MPSSCGCAHEPPRPEVASVPRVALTRLEAAAALGVGIDSFERHVQRELRLIRRGRLVLVPVAELARWADRAAETTPPEKPTSRADTGLVAQQKSLLRAEVS